MRRCAGAQRAAAAGGAGWRPAALALALALAGCLPLPGCAPPPPVDLDLFYREDVAPGRQRLAALHSLVATGDLDLESEGQRWLGRVRALYVAPDRLRIDVELPGFFSLLGGTGTLWAGADGYWWTSSSEPGLHPGGVDPIFGPLLGREPALRDLEAMLFGLPAWLPPAPSPPGSPIVAEPTVESELAGQPPEGDVRLAWPDGVREIGRIRGRPPRLKSVERFVDGDRVTIIRLDGYKDVAGVAVPSYLRLRSPQRGGLLRVEWKRIEADRPDAASRLDWPVSPPE